MDKISKALKKLSPKERLLIKNLLEQVQKTGLRGLVDVKKLVGQNNIFRIRKGDLRIILKLESDVYSLLTIERRSEKTYKDL